MGQQGEVGLRGYEVSHNRTKLPAVILTSFRFFKMPSYVVLSMI